MKTTLLITVLILGVCNFAQAEVVHTRIADVQNVHPVEGRDAMNATIEFDKRVPNRHGIMRVRVRERLIDLDVWPRGSRRLTRHMDTQWGPRNRIRPNELLGKRVRIIYRDDR